MTTKFCQTAVHAVANRIIISGALNIEVAD